MVPRSIYYKKTAQLVLFVFVLALGLYYAIDKRRADIVTVGSNISNQATAKFKIGTSTSYSTRVSSVITGRTDSNIIGTIASRLQGRAAEKRSGLQGVVEVIDPSSGSVLGTVDFKYDNGDPKVNFDQVSGISRSVLYDIRISIKGYLPKKIRNVRLDGNVELDSGGTVLAGDISRSSVGIINWDDFSAWKQSYGKGITSSDDPDFAKDFNGDGIINYFDFAIAYGSDNWQKTENAQ
ncbi:MAG TPA: hypothetical protein PK263_02200 [bacterium]|nr:hypothetical protein [bacterium]